YEGAWRGRGWYWCGYANRVGIGWGGPVGWRGWHVSGRYGGRVGRVGGRYGGRVGAGRVGAGRVGAGRVGAGRVGAGRVGAGRVGAGGVRAGGVRAGRVGTGRVEASGVRAGRGGVRDRARGRRGRAAAERLDANLGQILARGFLDLRLLSVRQLDLDLVTHLCPSFLADMQGKLGARFASSSCPFRSDS